MVYAGALIKNEKGEFLFQLRDNKSDIPNPNKWSIFGGRVEKNETPERAVIRELKEELDLDVDKSNLKKIVRIFRNHIFLVNINKGAKIILKEGKSLRFFKINEIKKKKNIVASVKIGLIFLPLFRFKHSF